MTLAPGDVVLVTFPFSDLSGAKLRPALVMSRRDYNAASEDVIVCAMTSNLANASRSVLVERGDLASGRIAATSRVKADRVHSLSQALVKRTVARVKPGVHERVKRELLAIL